MKNTSDGKFSKVLITVAQAIVISTFVFSSCERENFGWNGKRSVIGVNVSSVRGTETKAGACADGGREVIDSFSIDIHGDEPLSVTAYSSDYEELPFDLSELTKGAVNTSSGLNQSGRSFVLNAWLGSENRYPNDAGNGRTYEQGGSTGRMNNEADKDNYRFVKDVDVTYTSGKWATSGDYYWRSDVPTTFWSYYPKTLDKGTRTITWPGDKASDADQARIEFSYTLPAATDDKKDAESQEDLLFAYNLDRWTESHSESVVNIDFFHALSAVRFDISGVSEDVTISQIYLKDIPSGGTCNVAPDVDGKLQFAWTPSTAKATFRQVFSATDFTEKSLDGNTENALQPLTSSKTFFLVPQTIKGAGVKLGLVYTKSGETTSVEYELDHDAPWVSGKFYTYKIGLDPHTYEYTFELEKESDGQKIYKNTTEAINDVIKLSSFRTVDAADEEDVAWVIKSVKVGSSSSVDVNDVSFEGQGGLDATIDGDELKIVVSERTTANHGGHDYWLNQNPKRTENLDWSPESWEDKGVIDLSKFNFQTESTNNPMSTANCYIIRHAGTYKLPLVYGNAIVNGDVNEQSYYPNCKGDVSGGTLRLDRFQNHNGNGITSAFIENNADCGGSGLKCAVVWQDKAEVVKNLQIVNGATTGTAGSYTTADVRYLQFTISQEDICQNNALICIYKDKTGGTTGKYDSGEAVWSWHIWTTNDPALLSDPIAVTNKTNKQYDFFHLYNLGWIDPDYYPFRPDMRIVLQQERSGNEIEITVSQPSVEPFAGNGCYYQFGRKDPMPAVNVNSTYPIAKSGLSTLSNAICTPEIFYTVNNSTKDWLTGTHYYNLWTGKMSDVGQYDQNDDIIKTVYDPSPVGYQMPASSAYTGFTDTGGNVASGAPNKCNINGAFNKGWYFYTKPSKQGDTIYFPAAGYRYVENGIVSSLGTYGRYWSAVPVDWGYGYHMTLSKTFVYPINTTHLRGEGYTVRPVKEK